MGSPLNFATLCCLAFTVVHIHGELVLLLYPADANSRTQSYTCMSNDEGAAFIWSVTGKVRPVKGFKPKRPASGNVRDCGIRGESTCLAKWDKTTDWQLVNSAAKPTGPVIDQRFEGFQEFGIPKDGDWRYYRVGVANKSSSTVWFSVQETKAGYFGVLLCQREELHLGPCVDIWTGYRGSEINVRDVKLPSGVYNGNLRGIISKSEWQIDTPWSRNPNGDEWETFRLEWNTQQKTIKMFRGNNSEPFFQADNMPAWDKVSALGASMATAEPRLRFHFYDYYFTDTKNAVISTKGITHSGKMFCAELLHGEKKLEMIA